ncbi:MAG: lysophospholipid acyltransferase family protein, partial [Chloroflexota bacterium]
MPQGDHPGRSFLPRLPRWIRIRRRRTPLPRVIAWLGSASISSLDASGAARVPPEGAGCIVAFNHPNRYDGLMLFSLIPRRDVATLVTGDMRRYPVRRFLVELAGGVWVEPGGSEDTMQAMLRLAADGWALMLAPEGQTTGEAGIVRGRRG